MAVVASRYVVAVSVFFNRVQFLPDDPHKAVMNTDKRVIIPSQLNLRKIVSSILNGLATKLTNAIQFFDFVVMLLSRSD